MKWLDEISFDAAGLVPVVAQDVATGEVLMLAYADRDALQRTLATGYAHYFSRSRGKLWKKGETSGHLQRIAEVRTDCDADAVLYRVRQTGPACHTLQRSCFFRAVEDGELAPGGSAAHVLAALEETIRERHSELPEGSYTTYLFQQGLDKILKKVGEESTEVVIAAKNAAHDELRSETADLLFHLLVLLRAQGVELDSVWDELESRFGRKSRIPGSRASKLTG
jgi:phosphoribosyl-AMP cyclohydrolase / phosphoribosyl-ATP pyrophosphohydrolase